MGVLSIIFLESLPKKYNYCLKQNYDAETVRTTELFKQSRIV